MKLSAQQIDQLYAFTRQHFVEWYDLQSELVDHLANAIEQEWEQNPNRTFEKPEQRISEIWSFWFYGCGGGKTKIFETENTVGSFGNYYKEFFSLPKIILTMALSLWISYYNS